MPIPKTPLSSDWSLQPDSTKLDSLVIAHQPRRGEYVPGPEGAAGTPPFWSLEIPNRMETFLSGLVLLMFVCKDMKENQRSRASSGQIEVRLTVL